MNKILKRLLPILVVLSGGFFGAVHAAPQTQQEARAQLFSAVKVYEDNQFGFTIGGIWYWINKPNYLIALDVGGTAYNFIDVASFERISENSSGDFLSVRLRTGEVIKAPYGKINWIACRNVSVGSIPCKEGGRITNMANIDPMNDFDRVFSFAKEDELREINRDQSAVVFDVASRPIMPPPGVSIKVLIGEEFRKAKTRIDDYVAILKSEKIRVKEKEDRDLAALRSPERVAKFQTEVQEELRYWQKENLGSRIFCETSYGVGATPGSVVVSLTDKDKVRCKGRETKEVRIATLTQAGWKIIEQTSRPFSDGIGEHNYLVHAQVTLQKIK